MAEVLRLTFEADKQSIFVYDATGSYDKDCNPGGWGSPNLEPENIEESTIEVFPPESEEGITIDVIAAIPNKECIGFEITAEDLGLMEISSGVWKFVRRDVSATNNFDMQISVYKYFDDSISCCVDNKMLKVDIANPTSDSDKKAIELATLLEIARWTACKGDLISAQAQAKYIGLQCECCL